MLPSNYFQRSCVDQASQVSFPFGCAVFNMPYATAQGVVVYRQTWIWQPNAPKVVKQMHSILFSRNSLSSSSIWKKYVVSPQSLRMNDIFSCFDWSYQCRCPCGCGCWNNENADANVNKDAGKDAGNSSSWQGFLFSHQHSNGGKRLSFIRFRVMGMEINLPWKRCWPSGYGLPYSIRILQHQEWILYAAFCTR